ncbi:MAG: hemolysin family protein [Candidatus Azobacteroides sp.]|nr:hemolysin family protein [Candidatus Azobacteroides sp.]
MNLIVIVVILIAFLLSVFFPAAEIAFVSSNKLFFELEGKRSGVKNRALNLFYKHSTSFIISMQVGFIISLVIYGLLTVEFLTDKIETSVNDFILLLIQISIASVLILLGNILFFKMFFRQNAELFLSFWAIPLSVFFILLSPVTIIILAMAVFFMKMFGIKTLPRQIFPTLAKNDLDSFIQKTIDDSAENAELETEVKYFQNALDFSNVKLRNCIVPRTEIVALSLETPVEELLTVFIETGLSKILVYKEDIDDIVGYIHSSEMFAKPEDWTEQINPVTVVPENMAANKLMKNMLREKKNIAVVVDEFGGTSGVITLEDLVEEIFGEFEDEHDTKSQIARKISDTEFIFSGRSEIDKINEDFGLEIPESEEYVTIAGYILNHHRNFPKLNESIKIGSYLFKIVKVTSTKIELVRMKIEE